MAACKQLVEDKRIVALMEKNKERGGRGIRMINDERESTEGGSREEQ